MINCFFGVARSLIHLDCEKGGVDLYSFFFFNLNFFADFLCIVSLWCFYSILIIINFNVLKYIKKIFKILIYF